MKSFRSKMEQVNLKISMRIDIKEEKHSKQLANAADEIIQIKDGTIQFKDQYED